MQRRQRNILWTLIGIAFVVFVTSGWKAFSFLANEPLDRVYSGNQAGQQAMAVDQAREDRAILEARVGEAFFWVFVGLLVLAWVDERLRAQAGSCGFPVVFNDGKKADYAASECSTEQR